MNEDMGLMIRIAGGLIIGCWRLDKEERNAIFGVIFGIMMIVCLGALCFGCMIPEIPLIILMASIMGWGIFDVIDYVKEHKLKKNKKSVCDELESIFPVLSDEDLRKIDLI